MREKFGKIFFSFIIFGLVAIAFGLLLSGGKGATLSAAELDELCASFGVNAAQRPVIAFVADWCPMCRKAEKYFHQQQISYIRADIEADSTAKQWYRKVAAKTGRQGIPQILIGNEIMVGFSSSVFQHKYDLLKQ